MFIFLYLHRSYRIDVVYFFDLKLFDVGQNYTLGSKNDVKKMAVSVLRRVVVRDDRFLPQKIRLKSV